MWTLSWLNSGKGEDGKECNGSVKGEDVFLETFHPLERPLDGCLSFYRSSQTGEGRAHLDIPEEGRDSGCIGEVEREMDTTTGEYPHGNGWQHEEKKGLALIRQLWFLVKFLAKLPRMKGETDSELTSLHTKTRRKQRNSRIFSGIFWALPEPRKFQLAPLNLQNLLVDIFFRWSICWANWIPSSLPLLSSLLHALKTTCSP